MTQFPRITRDPAVMSGRACLRDTHVTISTVVALLGAGRSREEIIRMLPVLTPEDLAEALAYAAWGIDELDASQSSPTCVDRPASHRPTLPRMYFKPVADPAEEAPSHPRPVAKPQETAAPDAHPSSRAEAVEADKEIKAEAEDEWEDTLEPPPSEGTPEVEESLELFHPAYPDQPTVVVTRHGLFDRRWGTHTIAWSDIREIQRKSNKKTVDIILHNPEFYLSSMPFFQRLRAQIKLAFDMHSLHLDTASLGVRTKDLFFLANRLWMRHRGKMRFRKKRRVRIKGGSSGSPRSPEWERYQPM